MVAIPRNRVRISTCPAQRLLPAISAKRASSVASWRSIPSRCVSSCSSAAWASGSSRPGARATRDAASSRRSCPRERSGRDATAA